MDNDLKYMKLALKLSERGRGFTEPNPMVGAVLVQRGRVAALGYHRRCGCDHAERCALTDVGEPGGVLYVTLEPCSHFGRTPPCADLIIEKKVGRVVVAMQDPNPLVNGKGIARLRENNIQVDVGLMEEMARRLNRHYLTYITGSRPWVTLKAGLSLDGKLTDKFRKSQWVTGEELRYYSHNLRGEFSAIMAGVGTIRDDNPQLNIRHPDWGDKKFYRVVLDSQNSLDPSKYRIFSEQERFPLILFSSRYAPERTTKTRHHFFIDPGPEGGVDLLQALETLHRLHIASVMVEGGASLFNSFISGGWYDEIIISQSGALIGGKDSLQVFPGGAPVTAAVELKNREIIKLEQGCIIRGYR